MGHVKNFKNYENTNESIKLEPVKEPEPGQLLGGPYKGGNPVVLVLLALDYGFSKISKLISFVEFTRAASKLTPIYDKIKDDEEMKGLVAKLDKYKNFLYFGEEEGRNLNRQAAFRLRYEIYQRAKELLTEKEYEVFISASKKMDSKGVSWLKDI